MMMPGREYQAQPSRFGFNGKENDNEVKGFGDQQDYGMRIYDGRIGRFLTVDPLTHKYPWYSPYQFSGNMPIRFIDVDGLEPGNPDMYVNSDASTTDSKYKTANLRIPKGEPDPVTKFGIGVLKGAIKIFGALTELPAQAHYGERINSGKKQDAFPLTGDQNVGTLAVNTFFWPVHILAQIKQDPSNPEVWGEAVTAFLVSGLAAKAKGTSIDLLNLAKERINFTIREFAKENIPIQQVSGIDFSYWAGNVRLTSGTEVIQWRRPGEAPQGSWYSSPEVNPNTLGIPADYSVGIKIKLTKSVDAIASIASNIENWLKPGSGEMLPGGGLQFTTRQIKIGENAEVTGYINRPK